MPELPEVQTIVNHLKKQLLKQEILDIHIYYPPITYFKDLHQMLHQRIQSIDRRGKYILIHCVDNTLIIHLRMEGKLFIQKSDDPIHKHTHVSFLFKDFRLDFNDTRKFGRIDVSDDVETYFKDKLGLEPFDVNCTAAYLKEKARHRSIPVKTLLLDQAVIAGIGNIYADESCFDAQLSPFKSSNRVSLAEYERLMVSLRKILKSALEDGGTTIRSYSVAHGIHGRFQQRLNVYGYAGRPCKVCNNILHKGRINGRSTVYCIECQKVSQNAHRHYRIDGFRKK